MNFVSYEEGSIPPPARGESVSVSSEDHLAKTRPEVKPQSEKDQATASQELVEARRQMTEAQAAQRREAQAKRELEAQVSSLTRELMQMRAVPQEKPAVNLADLERMPRAEREQLVSETVVPYFLEHQHNFSDIQVINLARECLERLQALYAPELDTGKMNSLEWQTQRLLLKRTLEAVGGAMGFVVIPDSDISKAGAEVLEQLQESLKAGKLKTALNSLFGGKTATAQAEEMLRSIQEIAGRRQAMLNEINLIQLEAEEIKYRAQEQAKSVLLEANQQATEIRRQGELDASEIREQADTYASSKRSEADKYAAEIRRSADSYYAERRIEADKLYSNKEREITQAQSQIDSLRVEIDALKKEKAQLLEDPELRVSHTQRLELRRQELESSLEGQIKRWNLEINNGKQPEILKTIILEVFNILRVADQELGAKKRADFAIHLADAWTKNIDERSVWFPLAKKVEECSDPEAVLELPGNSRQLCNYLADYFIVTGQQWTIIKSLSAFTELGQEELVDRLIDSHSGGDIARSIGNFPGLTHPVLAKKMIESGHIAELAENLGAFEGLGQGEADSLIANGFINRVGDCLPNFKGLSQAIAEQLMHETYFVERVARNLKSFKGLNFIELAYKCLYGDERTAGGRARNFAVSLLPHFPRGSLSVDIAEKLIQHEQEEQVYIYSSRFKAKDRDRIDELLIVWKEIFSKRRGYLPQRI